MEVGKPKIIYLRIMCRLLVGYLGSTFSAVVVFLGGTVERNIARKNQNKSETRKKSYKQRKLIVLSNCMLC